MGRNPKIRINFDSDVQYLLRLKHALEEDKDYPQDFKDAACSQIQTLTFTLMKAPPKRGIAGVEAAPKRKRA